MLVSALSIQTFKVVFAEKLMVDAFFLYTGIFGIFYLKISSFCMDVSGIFHQKERSMSALSINVLH
jgi:hypothetical protein